MGHVSAVALPGLHELAEAINQEAEAARVAAESAVEHARRAGEFLIEAKATVPHGQWRAWMGEHLSISPRTAQSYMALTRRLAALPESDAQRVAHLPLRAAVAALAEPRPADPLDTSFLDTPPSTHSRAEFSTHLHRVAALGKALGDSWTRVLAEMAEKVPENPGPGEADEAIQRTLHTLRVVIPELESKTARLAEEDRRLAPLVEEELDHLHLQAADAAPSLEGFHGDCWPPKSEANVRAFIERLGGCSHPKVTAQVIWAHWELARAREYHDKTGRWPISQDVRATLLVDAFQEFPPADGLPETRPVA